MGTRRVLLSEASSLTAREFVTVLGRAGVAVEAVSPVAAPIARFSRWCRAVHRVPAPSADPVGYLAAVDALMATGRFDALLPTHEQAWLFAAGRDRLPHAHVPVAPLAAFARVMSKVALAGALDAFGVPQPPWHRVDAEDDLDALGYPVWVKASYSTAGRGVRRVHNHAQAVHAWRRFTDDGAGPVMVQASAGGRYAQVQGVFAHGRLLAAAVSEQIAVGAGGSAAARLSVDHPVAVEALVALGRSLGWHGGLCLDYFHLDGRPSVIECNPRITEPGNAAAAGVDLPALLTALSRGGEVPATPLVTRAGVRTRSAMAIALGTAERERTRLAVLRSLGGALTGRGALRGSGEVLTPVLHDPPSIVPFAVTSALVLLRPANVDRLAGGAVATYGITPAAVDRLRATGS